MNISTILVASCTFILTACANFTSVHRPLNIDDGTGALIDIKQRGIIVSKHKTTDKNNNLISERTFVCAEPSPDAMSAFAAETSISIPDKVKLANAFQEGSTYTGLRTQSIQLLRDGMYRLCEARMSGFIDDDEYNLLIRRYQKNMVALLAIEQLTGTIKTPVTYISTSGSASLSQDIEQSEASIEKLQTEIASLTTEIEAEKNNGDNANQTVISSNQQKIANKQSLIASLKQSIENNKSMIASGSATASVVQTSQSENATNTQSIQNVQNAVQQITQSIINSDDLPIICINYLKTDSPNNSISGVCNTFLTSLVNSKKDLFNKKLELADSYIQANKLEKAKIILDSMDNSLKTYSYSDPSIFNTLLNKKEGK
ncbi:hypothetical protein [Vibrio salinus]|uniref:hypothetical protein n=1 Tax=Vibrio salinus TaxID=2899784 RepID=UPI001E5B390B|nr:hypothetical protein [Vibrio salinus]MCE0492836.1 hypothetical protein [Vibrio salinus]